MAREEGRKRIQAVSWQNGDHGGCHPGSEQREWPGPHMPGTGVKMQCQGFWGMSGGKSWAKGGFVISCRCGTSGGELGVQVGCGQRCRDLEVALGPWGL